MKYSHRLLAGLVSFAALGMATPAWSHAKLVSSNPADDAVVATAPSAITLKFNERVVPAFTKLELTMPEHGGMKVPVKVNVASDGKTVTGVPEARLGKGVYRIVWTAASGDGHKMNGNVNFKIG
jgi:methionine-rich copper-binding protein CopC